MSDALMPESPAPTFSITTDGMSIDEAIEIAAIDVSGEVGRPTRALLEILDGESSGDGFAIASSERFAPGRVLAIGLGHGNHSARVFRGRIGQLRLEADGSKTPHLVVIAEGAAIVTEPIDGTPPPIVRAVWGESVLGLRLETGSLSSEQRGVVQLEGTAELQQGGVMELAGLGPRFDGRVRLRAVKHTVRDGRWVTTAAWGRPFNS